MAGSFLRRVGRLPGVRRASAVSPFSSSSVYFANLDRPQITKLSKINNGIISCTLPMPQIPDINFGQYLLERAEQYGNQTCMIDAVSGKSLSFHDVINAARKVCSGLIKRGFKKGDVALVLSANHIDYCTAVLGILLAGGTSSHVNPAYTAEELKPPILTSQPRIIICGEECVGNALAAAKVASPEAVYVFGKAAGCVPFDELKEDDGSALPAGGFVPTSPTDIALLPYSSGTTGLPKGVILTHRNLIASHEAARSNTFKVFGESDVIAIVLPMFHMYGLRILAFGCFVAGSTAITLPRFDPSVYLKAIATYKVTHLYIVPPILLFMCQDPQAQKTDLSSVKGVLIGAAPSPQYYLNMFRDRLKLNYIREGYGLTEASGVVSQNIFGVSTAGSLGNLQSHFQAKILDLQSGQVLGPHQTGELCLKGPSVMGGYYKNEVATREAIDKDGWMRTGDVGYYNEDGCLYLTDRIKELIKYKTLQVAPAELEAKILEHPAVLDAAVIGIPDEKAGELPKAFVVLRPGKSASAEDITSFIAGKVASHKQLRGGVQFIDKIPKAASGKILRRVLKTTS